MSTGCLICEAADTVPFGQGRDHHTGDTFQLRRCSACGFVFVWPRPTALDPYYPAGYRDFPPLIRRLFQAIHRRRTRRWTRLVGRTGRALEVGCGYGWMLAGLRDQGWQVVGVERTAASARFAAEQLHLPVVVGDLGVFRSQPGFDLIVLSQVLEHLPDPLACLQECARLLAPGGWLVIAVPNLGSWQFRVLGPDWLHLDVPRHLGHLTPPALTAALERAGLEVRSLGFTSLEYDPFAWLDGVLNRLGLPQNTLLRLLQRDPRITRRPLTVLLAVGLALLLAIPSLLLTVVSWVAHAGAIMEVRAARSPARLPDHQAESPAQVFSRTRTT